MVHLQRWTEAWVAGVSSTPPTFGDVIVKSTPLARDHITQYLKNEINKLVSIAERKNSELQRSKGKARAGPAFSMSSDNTGILAALDNAYEGPGESRAEGPRHDNDFVNVSDIRIAPTHGELTSKYDPFLPGNLYGAPHPHPPESMQRLLDIQFRLLREELMCVFGFFPPQKEAHFLVERPSGRRFNLSWRISMQSLIRRLVSQI